MSDVEHFGNVKRKPATYLTIALDFENHNLILGQLDEGIPDIRVVHIIKRLQAGDTLVVDINTAMLAEDKA